jgi:predicted nucleic acid-binding protein
MWEKWHREGHSIVAPTLLFYEVSSVLRQYVARGELRLDEALKGLQAAVELDIAVYGDRGLNERALQMAEHLSLPTLHDAYYLALAETLDAEFWTVDAQLADLVASALPWVHRIEL